MAPVGRIAIKPPTEDEKMNAQKAACEMQNLALAERFLCYRLLPHGKQVQNLMDEYGQKYQLPPTRVTSVMVAGQWERHEEGPLYLIPLCKVGDAEIVVEGEDRIVVEWIPGTLVTLEKGCKLFMRGSGRVIFIASF